MTDPAGRRSVLDLVRREVEGDPSAHQIALLRSETDAATEEFRDALHVVTEALGPAAPPPATSRTTFARIERRIAEEAAPRPLRTGPWPRRTAAAILVACSVLAATHLAGPAAPPTVRLGVLANIASSVPDDAAARSALACGGLLAEHVPMRDGAVAWLSSLDRARDAARVTGRPVLLFLFHPSCPVCADLEASPLADPGVRRRIAEFVPVKLVASFDDPDPALDRDWPYFAILGADGLVLADLTLPATRDEFVAFLDDQIASRIAPGTMSWDRVRALASRLRSATAASPAGEPDLHHAQLAALAGDASAGPFAAAARSVLETSARDARRALVDAAAASATVAGPQPGRAILDDAVRRFAGTPYGEDLAAVRDAYVRSGRFPHLDPPIVGPADAVKR